MIAVAWGAPRGDRPALYPVDVMVEAADRQGLLRDISEVFAKEKMNVTGVKTQSVKDARGGTAWMTFTVEVADAARLAHVLGAGGAHRRRAQSRGARDASARTAAILPRLRRRVAQLVRAPP